MIENCIMISGFIFQCSSLLSNQVSCSSIVDYATTRVLIFILQQADVIHVRLVKHGYATITSNIYAIVA